MKIVNTVPWYYDAESKAPGSSSPELSGLNNLDNDDRVRVLAIGDQFRELAVNEDISLLQVSTPRAPFFSKISEMLIYIPCVARCRRRPIQRKILPPRRSNRPLIPNRLGAMYQIRHADCPPSCACVRSVHFDHPRSLLHTLMKRPESGFGVWKVHGDEDLGGA